MSVVAVGAQKPVLSLVRGLTRRIPGRRGQRVGRHHLENGWRVYLLQTATGQVGPALDPVGGSWEIVLNGTESMSAQVRKQDLAGIDRQWYSPWWGGLLFCWSRDGVETPIVAGPITKWSGETVDGITLEGGGLRAVLANLVVGTDLIVRDRSLGHIMWLLVKHAQIKPGGGLAVVDGSPDPGGRGHQRSYYRWDVANAQIDKRMTELSEVRNGPDVMLRPRWARDRRFIEWAVMHGTSASPAIHSDTIHDFDTTAARSAVASLEVTSDASALVSRVWASGAGEGQGTLITRAENLALVEAGFPFMEAVLSRSSVVADEGAPTGGETDPQQVSEAMQSRELSELAAGELAARVDAIDQITVRVRADDPRHGIDQFFVGDPAMVTLEGWLAVPDGTHETRIIKAGGGLDNEVTVDFQTEALV